MMMLKRALVWQDGSVDALFNDQSVISLVPDMQSFFYVPSKGATAHRMFTSFATNTTYRLQSYSPSHSLDNQNIRDKLLELLHFVNSHTTEPYLCRPNIPVTECDIFERETKIESAGWTMNSEFIELLDNGGVKVVSEDNLSKLILSPNGRGFKVVYPALIYSADTRKSKLEYTWICQFFSKGYFPSQWEVPLMIALYYYLSHNEKDQEMLDMIRSRLEMDRTYVTELPRTKTPLWSTPHHNNFHSESEDDVIARAKILVALDSTKGIEHSITSTTLKNRVGILLEYIAPSQIIFRYFSEAQNAELSLDHGNACFFLKTKPEPHCIQYDYEFKPTERVFMISGLGLQSSQTFHNKTNSHNIFDVIKSLVEFREKAEESCSTSYRTQINLSPAKKNGGIEIHVVEQICNDDGKFTLYSDNRIRCVFSDRTIVNVWENGFCRVITSEGEIWTTSLENPLSPVIPYLTEAVAFREWARRSDQEKQEELDRKEHLLELQSMADVLIDRSQVLLKIFENNANLKNEK